MIIHEIHDLSNSYATELLIQGLTKITDENYVKNYHPKYSSDPGNLFFVLEHKRYQQGKGKFFVIEENNEFACCAGWCQYDGAPNTAIGINRLYTDPKYRFNYYGGTVILPQSLEESKHYKNIWLTFDQWNARLHDRFVKAAAGERVNDWPEIYHQFIPIGKQVIYNVPQFVVEMKRPE